MPGNGFSNAGTCSLEGEGIKHLQTLLASYVKFEICNGFKLHVC